MMKQFVFLIFAIFLLPGCSFFGSQEYYVDQECSGQTVDLRTGDRLILILPAERDPYFSWRETAPLDPNVLARMNLKMGRVHKNDGPEIYVAQYEFKSVGPGFTGIALERRSPAERDGIHPMERFHLLVRAEGKPIAPDNIFGDDEKPPDTMTDSKGNVVKKPKKLLD